MNAEIEFNNALVALKEIYELTANVLMVPDEEISRRQKQFVARVVNIMRIKLREPGFENNYDLDWKYGDNLYSTINPDAGEEYLNAWDYLSDLYYEEQIDTSEMKDIYGMIILCMRNMVRLNRTNKLEPVNILEVGGIFTKNLKEDDRYSTFDDRDIKNVLSVRL